MVTEAVGGSHRGTLLAPDGAGQRVSLSGVSFGDVLRALNPLQYLPVIGTIYRAVTGDVAPMGLRAVVSAAAGLLTGGPIGLVTSIAGDLLEHYIPVEDELRATIGVSAMARAAGVGPDADPAIAGGADRPSAVSGPPSAPAIRVAEAYRSAGLLGAV